MICIKENKRRGLDFKSYTDTEAMDVFRNLGQEMCWIHIVSNLLGLCRHNVPRW